MADKLVYITNDDTQYYPFCTLQLVVETFEQSTKQKSQKLVSQEKNVIMKIWGLVSIWVRT